MIAGLQLSEKNPACGYETTTQPLVRTWLGLTLLMVTLVFTGCQNGPMAGRMQQSQLESERLLSEYRAQKKENEQLKADRAKLLQQQAETEKLAAKLQAQLNAARGMAGADSSRRPSSAGAVDARSASRTNDLTRPNDRFGGNRESTQDNSSDSEGLQWRPIRK